MRVLGIDTSNYTTSLAVYDSNDGFILKKEILLKVNAGERGLRQSDAVFQHTKNLPELFSFIPEELNLNAVAVSVSPRELQGSYMPCFLAGISAATAISSCLNVPLFQFSHQQGHVAAAAYSSGRTDLLSSPFLAWHLSGGTTELVLCSPNNQRIPNCNPIGGTMDASVGQIIDRTGVRLDFPFPCGKYLDKAALECKDQIKVFNLHSEKQNISFSGLENKACDLIKSSFSSEYISKYIFSTIAVSLKNATESVFSQYGNMPVLMSGGVSSSIFLHRFFAHDSTYIFSEPAFSTDNAAGIAYLGFLKLDNTNE